MCRRHDCNPCSPRRAATRRSGACATFDAVGWPRPATARPPTSESPGRTLRPCAPVSKRMVSRASFPAFIDRTHADQCRRVREGDLDHLVFYALQSTHFTRLPPIEPALSAKALVQGLDPDARDAFLRSPAAREPPIPAPVRARIAALIAALDSSSRDPRLAYFRGARAVDVSRSPATRGRVAPRVPARDAVHLC